MLEGRALPPTELLFFMDERGRAPVLDWLVRLDARDPRAADKCTARLKRLAALGHELRRPETDYLQDGLFGLRARHGRIHYRMIYFFHGKHTAVLVEGVTKKGRVPAAAVARALRRKLEFARDPAAHTYAR
jgi:phage-related protein